MRCLQDSGRICPAHALGRAVSPPRMHFIISPLANNPHSASHAATARGSAEEGTSHRSPFSGPAATCRCVMSSSSSPSSADKDNSL